MTSPLSWSSQTTIHNYGDLFATQNTSTSFIFQKQLCPFGLFNYRETNRATEKIMKIFAQAMNGCKAYWLLLLLSVSRVSLSWKSCKSNRAEVSDFLRNSSESTPPPEHVQFARDKSWPSGKAQSIKEFDWRINPLAQPHFAARWENPANPIGKLSSIKPLASSRENFSKILFLAFSINFIKLYQIFAGPTENVTNFLASKSHHKPNAHRPRSPLVRDIKCNLVDRHFQCEL